MVLALAVLAVRRLRANRDSKRADEDLTRQTTYLLVRLAAHGGDDRVIAPPGSSMIEGVAAHQENLGELLVVVGHHGGAGSLLGHSEEVVDILDGAEGLLPKLKLDGGVQLRKASIEMMLQSFWIGEIDGVDLVRILGDIGKVEAERLTQTTELDFALIL